MRKYKKKDATLNYSWLRNLLGIFLLFLSCQTASAYITLPSSSYTMKVGETKFLSAPSASKGYIDHSVWSCSNSAISFVKKDAVGAEITVIRDFTGTATIELVSVEKYVDSYGRTQAITYYKEFKINCSTAGVVNPTSISFPNTEIRIGDVVEITPKVTPSNATVTYKSYTPDRSGAAGIWVDFKSNTVKARGLVPGKSTCTIETTNGKTAIVAVTVLKPQIGTGTTDNNKLFNKVKLKEVIANMNKLVDATIIYKQ